MDFMMVTKASKIAPTPFGPNNRTRQSRCGPPTNSEILQEKLEELVPLLPIHSICFIRTSDFTKLVSQWTIHENGIRSSKDLRWNLHSIKSPFLFQLLDHLLLTGVHSFDVALGLKVEVFQVNLQLGASVFLGSWLKKDSVSFNAWMYVQLVIV